jgi:hypothetical protein
MFRCVLADLILFAPLAPLMVAASVGWPEIVDLLIAAGSGGQTALPSK